MKKWFPEKLTALKQMKALHALYSVIHSRKWVSKKSNNFIIDFFHTEKRIDNLPEHPPELHFKATGSFYKGKNMQTPGENIYQQKRDFTYITFPSATMKTAQLILPLKGNFTLLSLGENVNKNFEIILS